MLKGDLTGLQRRALKTLAQLKISWRLSGGGALIAAYTHHRMTRDIDLFFLRPELGDIPKMAISLLKQQGFSVSVVQTELNFCRLKIEQDKESLIIDLVAENTPPVEPPNIWVCEGASIQVDSIPRLCNFFSSDASAHFLSEAFI